MNLRKFLLSFLSLTTIGAGALTVIACNACTMQTSKNDEDDKIISNKEIVEAVNALDNYEAQISINSTYRQLRAEISATFIKLELENNLRNKFQDSDYQLVDITNENGRILNDDDFGEERVITGKIIYHYANHTNQITNVKIPIISTHDSEIIDAVNATTYEIEISINSSYNELKVEINANFIKAKLSNDLKEKFNDSHYRLFDIFDENNERELTNLDLITFGSINATINYGYITVFNEHTKLKIKVIAENETNIVSAINNVTDYRAIAYLNDEYSDLAEEVTDNFIKLKLNPDMQNQFNDAAFDLIAITDENGNKLTGDDFKTVHIINAKINYEYGTTKNQTTNLKIEVQKMELDNALAEFEVRDGRFVFDFLDANDLPTVQRQIEAHLDIPDFATAGLTFENQTSNSVTVKANDDSENYQGQTTINWNLKLFELLGLGNSIRGYYYLEKDTNLIKYFDAYYYIADDITTFHPYLDDYHRVIFRNGANQQRDFTINGKWITSKIPGWFRSLEFGTSATAQVSSPETSRFRVYNRTNRTWGAVTNNRTYSINRLGIVS